MIKEKPCKGTGKSISFQGCGKLTQHRKYGLCMSCYPEWLYSTDAGKLEIEKAQIKAKNVVIKKQKESINRLKEATKGIRDFKRDLQKEINTIVRLIDKGCVCICTQKHHNSNDSGHFYSRGSTPELAYNLNNIYLQSVYSNRDLSGDILRFQEGLITMYGKEHKEYVYNLKSKYPPFKPTKEEIINYIRIARQIVKELKQLDLNYSAEHRLKLRNEYNKRIGIYKDEL